MNAHDVHIKLKGFECERYVHINVQDVECTECSH